MANAFVGGYIAEKKNSLSRVANRLLALIRSLRAGQTRADTKLYFAISGSTHQYYLRRQELHSRC